MAEDETKWQSIPKQETTLNDTCTILHISTISDFNKNPLKQTDHAAKYIKETYIHKINFELY